MTTGEKLARLRKENNYTQEQLAQIMGVSRQSISKWESDVAYPETEKLIKLSDMYNCSLDYLLKDIIPEDNVNPTLVDEDKTKKQVEALTNIAMTKLEVWKNGKSSKRTIKGIPLWHIGKNSRGFIAIGLKARGVIAIGLCPIGIISIGLLPIGIIALGYLSIGLFSFGCFALGAASFGAISIGIISFGAVSIGQFALGACSIGHYFAWGDYAKAIFAFGASEAHGTIVEKLGELTETEKQQTIQMMKDYIPIYFRWIVSLVKWVL